MVQLVHQEVSTRSPAVMRALGSILNGLGRAQPTDLELARAVFWWVKQHIKFVTDEQTMVSGFGIHDLEQGKELLLSPSFMLMMDEPQGDCDDFSTLTATLLVLAGLPNVCFCTVAADPGQPRNYTHVFVKVVLHDGREFPLDVSHGQYPGWQTSDATSALNWFIYQAGLPGQLFGVNPLLSMIGL